MSFVCAYMGRPDECPECGGHNETGDRFCSHDCAADHDTRVAHLDRERQASRDQAAAFGREVDRLRALGHTDQEIDVLLAEMPS